MNTKLDDIDFEQLIGDRDIDIYKLIKEMNEDGVAITLYRYARYIVRGRWPEAELYIKKDPYWAYFYAKDIIGGKWPEAEPYIKKNPEWAYCYALNVIRGRWIEAESCITRDSYWAHHYSIHFKVKL